MAEAFFQSHRDDCTFDRFYVTAENEAKQYNIEQPVLLRYRRPSRRLDDGACPHVYSTPQEYYRRQYFGVLDLIKEELGRRFDQKSLAVPKAIEEMLLTACASQCTSTVDISIPEVIASTYSQDINIAKLKVQLLMLPDLMKTYKSPKSQSNISKDIISDVPCTYAF